MTRQRIQRLVTTAIAAFFLTAVHLQAQRGADPETRFRDAVQKQQAQGDLNGAIQIYQEIAASPNASHALKARALLQLATSMETQGQQAETVYERIVKEFPDQPEASNARKKLESLKPPTPLSFTQITFGSGVQNVVATDGQRAIYWGADRTTLFIGDNGGKTRKQIFTTTPQRLPRVEASRDLSLIFLYFVPTEAQGASYAVIRTDGLGAYRELALEDKGLLGPGTLPLYSVSWSFDNRYVVLCKMGQDRVVRPFKLSIDDGEIVALAPGHPTSIGYAVLSPDGRSLAFQEVIGNAGRGVFIEPVQGGEPEALAPNWGFVGDWTLDGRYLIFGASNPPEGSSLYTIPVRDGRVTGDRIFVRSLRASEISRPVTTGSALIFTELVNNPTDKRLYHASLDAESRLGEWTALRPFVNEEGGAFSAVISPDGTKFAYRTGRNNSRAPGTVRLYTLATGDDRELFRSEGPITNCAWASQPSVLYCGQPRVAQQKTDILSIDVTTGSAKTIASFPGIRVMKRLSPDERTLEMFNPSGPTPWPRWEIGADQETPGSPQDTYTSRDGRWALRSGADGANRREFQIRPASSGDKAWEHLVYLRKQSPDTRGPVPWEITRDGNWLLYVDLDSDGQDALFRVNTSGGEPQRLGGYPTSLPNSYLVISPDGRQFLVETVLPSALARGLQGEFWLLQNFLPRAATPKP